MENIEPTGCGNAGAPTAPDTMHRKPLPRKVPPHMRRLNMRFPTGMPRG